MNFADKNISVVGGNSGIALRIVQDLVKNGANVYIAFRTKNPGFASMKYQITIYRYFYRQFLIVLCLPSREVGRPGILSHSDNTKVFSIFKYF